MKCSICGKEITGYGNNSDPLKGDKCCDTCNNEIVLPVRIMVSKRKENIGTKEQEEEELNDECPVCNEDIENLKTYFGCEKCGRRFDSLDCLKEHGCNVEGLEDYS